ncbi:metal-dependent transcriptional regulator [Halobellus limi]|uniref:Iron (Metal) dependent repressor, DtxR family n=1 Tax=Halobellus limi TaxID=699433 RepID=A0A1H6BHW1_9EURY|nr:metal-dependent transcriptional regulator [Halobellus limi]QCC49050.1 metal-dependent transcriptional regulator [Halobellus limi]SEG60309.1 iron (metal) dependent repressor, DtxR family [Halobellus limi]
MTRKSQYLLALYIEEQRSPPPVSSGRIAERLDRSASTATEMFGRLEADGLLTHEPYAGATLTEDGRARAEELHESYVALSWFFRVVLELDDHEREAMEIAGLLRPAVAERLCGLVFEDLDGVEAEDVSLPRDDHR